jgi:hypothetical protein
LDQNRSVTGIQGISSPVSMTPGLFSHVSWSEPYRMSDSSCVSQHTLLNFIVSESPVRVLVSRVRLLVGRFSFYL